MSREPLTKRMWQYAGSPSDGTSGTYAGDEWLETGDILIDTSNGNLYQNEGTKASPTWTPVLKSVNKANLGADVTIRLPIPLSGIFDNETIELGPLGEAGEIVAVFYDTDASPGLGTGVGIDVIDGGTDGNGTDVIDHCADNLSGSDYNTLTTPYAMSADDYLRVKFDDFAASTYRSTVVIMYEVALVNAT